MSAQKHRDRQLRTLTNAIGVYALCDLDEVPIYIGQSVDGIRARVRRHLTSARSDVVANRQIDVWEVAFVWAWPIENQAHIGDVESELFHQFDARSTLMNGSVPARPTSTPAIPEPHRLQVLTDEEIARRKEPQYRFPRQALQVASLLDYILETMDKKHLRRSLHAHFERMQRYYNGFQGKLLEEFEHKPDGQPEP